MVGVVGAGPPGLTEKEKKKINNTSTKHTHKKHTPTQSRRRGVINYVVLVCGSFLNWIEKSEERWRSEKKAARKRWRGEEEGNWVRQESGEVGQRGGLDCRNIIDTPSSPLQCPPPVSDQQLHLSKLWSIPAEWTWPWMEIDGDRLNSISSLSPLVLSRSFSVSLSLVCRWRQMARGPWPRPLQIDYWSGGQRWIEGWRGHRAAWKGGEVGGFQGIYALRLGLKDGGMRRGGRTDVDEDEAKVFFSSVITLRGCYWLSSRFTAKI